MTASVSASAPTGQTTAQLPMISRDDLRVFHLSRSAPAGMSGLSGALFPRLLDELAKPERAFADWPLVVAADGQVERCMAWLRRQLPEAALLRAHLPRVVRAVARSLPDTGEPIELADAMRTALEGLRCEFDVSDHGAVALSRELDTLRTAVPTGALALGFGPNASLWLLAWAIERRSADATRALRAETTDLVSHLRELLRNDDRHGPAGNSQQTLAAGLGDAGGLLVDAAALAGKLPPPAGTQRLPRERRQRIERAIATLDGWLAAPTPVAVAVATAPLPQALLQRGWRTEVAAEPVVAARGLFDQLARQAMTVAGAFELARLECSGRWEDRLAPLVEFVDWRAFDTADWRFVPPVVAVVRGLAEALAAAPGLTELERSRRPVRVMATYTGSADPACGLQAVGRALGLLALARPTGMQAATAVAKPVHMTATLNQVAAAQSLAVVAVAEPPWSAGWPWLEAALLHQCQATLCFRWSDLPGAGWADAFDVAGNPPLHGTNASNGGGAELWSPAHAALLEPVLRDQFWFLPGEGEVAGLVQLELWRETPAEARNRLLPFVWARDAAGTVGRAVLTRELAQAVQSQARWWQCLRELAGLDNPFVARAVADARADAAATAAAEKLALQAEHQRALLCAREEASAAALDSLARALLTLDLGAVGNLSAASVPAKPPAQLGADTAATAPKSEVSAPVAEAPPMAPADVTEDAYVETALCTSCNDCTNINPLLFVYDANKQAHLGDLSKGTYLQLVNAAEKCPARCIHPGAPLPGDATATAEVVVRAAKFN